MGPSTGGSPGIAPPSPRASAARDASGPAETGALWLAAGTTAPPALQPPPLPADSTVAPAQGADLSSPLPALPFLAYLDSLGADQPARNAAPPLPACVTQAFDAWAPPAAGTALAGVVTEPAVASLAATTAATASPAASREPIGAHGPALTPRRPSLAPLFGPHRLRSTYAATWQPQRCSYITRLQLQDGALLQRPQTGNRTIRAPSRLLCPRWQPRSPRCLLNACAPRG